jgi:hypothetical protein
VNGREFSLANLENGPESLQISLELQMQKFYKRSYLDFVDLIHKALNFSISLMAAAKNITLGMDEDQLTHDLLLPLIGMAFDVTHSTNVGGNCDIVVTGHSSYLWLGEAKVFSSYGKLLGGYRQLADRYSTGLPNQDHGAVIVYMVTHGNAKNRMQEWEEYLKVSETGVKTTRTKERPLEFSSVQDHQGTGLPIYVQHVPVVLFHVPTDVKKPPTRIRK